MNEEELEILALRPEQVEAPLFPELAHAAMRAGYLRPFVESLWREYDTGREQARDARWRNRQRSREYGDAQEPYNRQAWLESVETWRRLEAVR